MPGKSGTAARHPIPRFALVILSGAHRLDSGHPSLPDWSTQVDPKQSSSRGALNAYSCLFSSSAAPLGRLRRPQAIRSATQSRSRAPSLRLCRETGAAGADQAGIWRLEAPEGAAGRAFEKDVAVVRTAEGEIRCCYLAVRDRHKAEDDAARVNLEDAAEPEGRSPQVTLNVIMDAVGAAATR